MYFLLGQIYYRKKEFKKSEQAFLKCLNFEHFSDKIFLYLALCYVKLKHFDMARELYEKYPKYDDHGMFLYAKALHNQAHSVESLKIINNFIKIN